MISESVAPNDLFSLRHIRDARLSPDGRFVAYAVSRTVETQNAEYCELWIRGASRWEMCGHLRVAMFS